jgi:ribonuclease T2
MSSDPAAYFSTARRLYARLRSPDMTGLSRRNNLTLGQFAVAFARANSGMKPDVLRVIAGRAGALEEVRVCLDRRWRYARCRARSGPLGAPLRIMPPAA